MRPFLTIVTRCCDRPRFLRRNINSIKIQTNQSIEQVFIVDKERLGRYHANQSFRYNTHRIDGEYVFIIDDDCRLKDKLFVQKVYDGVQACDNAPDIVMVQTSRPQIKPKRLPKDDVWGNFHNIRIHSTNCLCYVVRRDIWVKYAYGFGKPAAGDWHFLKEIWRNSSADKFIWVPGIFSETMQLGRGKKFELKQNIVGWWEDIVAEFGIVDLGEGDWRLRLWRR